MIIQVGKAINNILTNDKTVTAKIGKRIFPLIANVDTQFPFVVYRRNSIIPVDSKDKFSHEESATIEVVIAANSYNESIEIAELISKSLQGKKGNFSGVEIKKIQLTEAAEDFIEDTYIQRLTFIITTISE